MSETGKHNKKPEDSPRNRRLGNRAIGDKLRQMYEGVVAESVPDEFLQLLDEAEAREHDANRAAGGET
ncbi:MAG: NepR family anti-sigma factor [Hyphomonas sp.]|uniref:NepR family anti-sigma factor n=1 Tax=Hyphomonas sp. TaxID=87 RepID=UPI0034A01E0D